MAMPSTSPARSAVRGDIVLGGGRSDVEMSRVGRMTYCTWSSSSVAIRMRPSPQTPASACASSSAVWKRLAGSREQARANHASKPAGTSGFTCDGAGMGAAHTLRTMSPSTSPSNGRRPVIAAKVHAPKDHRSVSGPGAPPMASCSGAMKFGVPMTVPSRVGPPIVRFCSPSAGCSSKIFAIPKSTSLTT